ACGASRKVEAATLDYLRAWGNGESNVLSWRFTRLDREDRQPVAAFHTVLMAMGQLPQDGAHIPRPIDDRETPPGGRRMIELLAEVLDKAGIAGMQDRLVQSGGFRVEAQDLLAAGQVIERQVFCEPCS